MASTLIDPPIKEAYVSSSCWNGSHYSNHSEWQFNMARKALDFIEMPSNGSILDIGCGDGRFTKYLANSVPHSTVLGLEPNPSMLATAQTHAQDNLSFIAGNAESLDYKNKFDSIVAFNSLHWVFDTKLALERVRDALVPGGQALILVVPIQVRSPLHQIIDRVARNEKWGTYFSSIKSLFSFHTLGEWASFVEYVGLIPENLSLMNASFDYKDVDSFAESVAAWVPFGAIPETKRAEYVSDIVQAYLEAIPCGPSGEVHYILDELVVLASKPSI